MKLPLRQILVIQTAFIGDVILATAVIAKIKNSFPDAVIDILVKKENRQVLEGHPLIRNILGFDKNSKLKDLLRIIGEVRKQRYDLVVNLQRFASSGMVTAFSGARFTSGFRKNPFSLFFTRRYEHTIGETGNYIHEIARNQQLISEFTDNKASLPVLFLTTAVMESVRIYQAKPYICIAPASVWFTKQFPRERWVELTAILAPEYTVYLLGGPGDQVLMDWISSHTPHKNVVNLAGKLSLIGSAALMKGSVLNYVNDSAPLHLCSAVNAPVCAIFCSTLPAFGFGPLADFSRIVEIDYALVCRPCSLHGLKVCPLGHFKCANDISLQKMIHVLKEAEAWKNRLL